MHSQSDTREELASSLCPMARISLKSGAIPKEKEEEKMHLKTSFYDTKYYT